MILSRWRSQKEILPGSRAADTLGRRASLPPSSRSVPSPASDVRSPRTRYLSKGREERRGLGGRSAGARRQFRRRRPLPDRTAIGAYLGANSRRWASTEILPRGKVSLISLSAAADVPSQSLATILICEDDPSLRLLLRPGDRATRLPRRRSRRRRGRNRARSQRGAGPGRGRHAPPRSQRDRRRAERSETGPGSRRRRS